ncbi:DUF1501 domain-containing protein [Paraliomyxa miuraensis]|uniref:DUF1501 domain-containing protein n=1 Tax=Paraliomyxa miuraensis TaxID=376150 RepID=UPI00225066F3|nr:DUF1501 domain-containing protein [Paraliomyxa miuraensis]MCX4245972.1 DUF1501 domain-containing protein [Paraliomyxa miuraensis]
MLTRRSLIGSLAASTAVLAATPAVLADRGDARCRFLFINAEGGWDPLCVFAPMFDSAEIELEPDAEPWTIGGLSLVDHPQRPLTRGFFERRHGDVALLNGVSTRSVNHETCQLVALTGSTSEERPDWATLLGQAQRDDNPLPHLVVSGPSFPGPYAVFVSHAEGLLQPTIDGSILLRSEAPLPLPPAPSSRVVDRFLHARGAARASVAPQAPMLSDYREALARARSLSDAGLQLRLVSGEDFRGRLQTAVSALASGVCRCATVGTGFSWDTHDDNRLQTGLFEGFFGDLDELLVTLAETLGPGGQPLAQDTVVVVTSEMARTPAFNGTGGRDHWPFTSMMVMGPGIVGGRSFGGFTSLYTGIGVGSDGGPDPSQPGISAEALGASLLVLGGIDPGEVLRGEVEPIAGLLA